jgi:hypothetical protein
VLINLGMMESEFCKGLKLVGGKRTPVVTKRHHRGNGSHHQAEKRNKAQTDGKQLLMKAASAKRLDVPKSSGPKMRKQQTSSVQAKPANTRLVLNLIEAACWRSISAVVTSCGWAFLPCVVSSHPQKRGACLQCSLRMRLRTSAKAGCCLASRCHLVCKRIDTILQQRLACTTAVGAVGLREL